ncbi:carboxymuconolactone decarboxylase family protein [Rhizobium lentis]|uniref:carboxymuconolactone decarboxylase family protein n=1 Tax=Rhizobium lentis TaxID=1138194 RepID=UPI00287F959F|nr:carboxymuconolactone decarboxylase family protein [Rhizobium lentis]
MSRLPIPTLETAPPASRPMLEGVKRQLSIVPNMYRLMSVSPASLEGYLALFRSLSNGRLSPQTRNRIALAIAEIDSCDYCLSAHTYIGRHLLRLDEHGSEGERRSTLT